MMDIGNIRSEQLSDEQIETLIEQARLRGLSVQDIEAEAIARGMPYEEVLKLRQRIENLTREGQPLRGEAGIMGRRVGNEELLSQRAIKDTIIKDNRIEVFGHDLFKRENLSFAPSLNIPTPMGYILGPGDEIIIEVWGASQQTYNLTVSPEGQVNIRNIGLVKVDGLTIEVASEILLNRLSSVYAELKRPNPNTFAQVSLGNIRSIKVTIAGDAYMPGTYVLPAFATVFNALYLAGGPSERGTLREIKVIRNGSEFTSFDLYDFLLRGETKMNLRLQNEDLIFIKPYKNRVIVGGAVKRPAVYELLENETLQDLIYFAGGFSSEAFSKRLTIFRKTDAQRSIVDVESELFSTFLMVDGDSLNVGPILDRFENRVTIQGAVYREGEYGIVDGLTLLGLINIAEGLREDAFLHRAAIYRLGENLRVEVLDVNLENIIDGIEEDVLLQREDMVVISSVLELQQEKVVEIIGEVQFPNTYPHFKNLTVGELIRNAGGLTDAASLSRLEIARRITDRLSVTSGNRIAQVYSFPIDSMLSLDDKASSFVLEPFDVIFVRRSPNYQKQVMVEVQGEINFPGQYAISQKAERISDLVKRAGGLTDDAFIAGATLVRQVDVYQADRIERFAVIDTVVQVMETANLLESDEQTIGINLSRILENPGGRDDLILMEGDVLTIPQELQTVRLHGALLFPTTTIFQENLGLRQYISQAGGFAPNAHRRNVYVIYANGFVDRTRNFLFFNSFPTVQPGADIVVPLKPEREERPVHETIAIGTAVSSLALIIVTILNQLR
ncbi:MAG TPA: SLBB domain-containing protein [Bacteroidales bacterium]|nr:SLBB domain-containing protein [Bacteroidales bacterium]